MAQTQNNVTSITDKQPHPACRFSIQATLNGFPITVEGEGRAGDLKIIVERLLAIGAEPPKQYASATQATGGQGDGAKKAPPKCSVHNSPMKQGRRGWFCPRKDDDGYCDQTV